MEATQLSRLPQRKPPQHRLSRLLGAVIVLLLALGSFIPVRIAEARFIDFGSGIHLYVYCEHFPDGTKRCRYVRECPVPLPSNATCQLTVQDFPIDHPYRTRALVTVNERELAPANAHLYPEGLMVEVGQPWIAIPVDTPPRGEEIIASIINTYPNVTRVQFWEVHEIRR